MNLSHIRNKIVLLTNDLESKLEKHPNSCSNISTALNDLRHAAANVQAAIDTDTAVGFVEAEEKEEEETVHE